jgi:hypothetical protein
VFDHACQIAEQMGLYQRPISTNQASTNEIEQQNLVWLLYLVDKQRVFIRGTPCRLYIFDFNMDLPPARGVVWHQNALLSHLELACILEDIYKYLYSPKAQRSSRPIRRESLRRLQRQLEVWSMEHKPELEIEGAATRENAVLLQLRYAWKTAELLIAEQDDEASELSRLELAREALRVVQTLCGWPYMFNGGLVVLERYANV